MRSQSSSPSRDEARQDRREIRRDRRTKKHLGRTKTAGIESDYLSRLRQIAKHVGTLITGFPAGDVETLPTMLNLLEAYSIALKPWAAITATRMLNGVNARNAVMWGGLSEAIGTQLRHDIRNTNVGTVLRGLLDEQVTLITSLPREAGERVHKLTIEGLEDSTRASTIAKEIMRSGEVSASRAQLIAVTEVARTASVLTEARAQSAGSTHYTWRTSGDSSVRPDHKILNGKVFSWDAPPIADRRTDERAHPGRIYRCRCYAEPIIS